MSVLKPGALCITVGHTYNPKNNGRIVRVLYRVGAWRRIVDGYMIEVVNGIPFSTTVQMHGGDRTLVHNRSTRCIAERRRLRPLLPGIDNASIAGVKATPVPQKKRARRNDVVDVT